MERDMEHIHYHYWSPQWFAWATSFVAGVGFGVISAVAIILV